MENGEYKSFQALKVSWVIREAE